MIKIRIVGDGPLAAVTRRCCAGRFDLASDTPDLLWICADTPIHADGRADVRPILELVAFGLHAVSPRQPLVVLSSQVPIGTTHWLETLFPSVTCVYVPENVRVAHADEDFNSQPRIVIGRRTIAHDALLADVFSQFSHQLIWTDPETAELSKHALNAFFGLQIAYINELANVAAAVGADVAVVSRALLTDWRVSPHAPLRPGAPFGGGHLSRDLHVLEDLAARLNLTVPIVQAIHPSNQRRVAVSLA